MGSNQELPLDQWSDPRRYRLDSDCGPAVVGGRVDERKFAIRLGVTAVGELLAKLGLTPQKRLTRR